MNLDDGVLHGLGIITIDATKLCGTKPRRSAPANSSAVIHATRGVRCMCHAAKGALWIGGIPAHLVDGPLNLAYSRVRALFEQFGEVVSVTLRKKSGEICTAAAFFSDRKIIAVALYRHEQKLGTFNVQHRSGCNSCHRSWG